MQVLIDILIGTLSGYTEQPVIGQWSLAYDLCGSGRIQRHMHLQSQKAKSSGTGSGRPDVSRVDWYYAEAH